MEGNVLQIASRKSSMYVPTHVRDSTLSREERVLHVGGPLESSRLAPSVGGGEIEGVELIGAGTEGALNHAAAPEGVVPGVGVE